MADSAVLTQDQNHQTPSSSAREQVPVLGYRNYWYPAMAARAVRKRPRHIKMLGDDIALFRDSESRKIYAMADRCPHRNAPLSQGNVFYPGTLSCIYHGWTFNTQGELVAVLSEGPDCPMVGKVHQRTYPVREFRDFIWIWMGEGKPVPLEDDLPPEITDPAATLFCSTEKWNANWRPVTENTDGYHAPILHYNSMPRVLFMNWVAWRKTAYVESEDGLGVLFTEANSEDEATYPGLGDWPPYPRWKRLAKKLFRAKTARGRPVTLPNGKTGTITEDVHLPGWRRIRVRVHTTFIAWAVPIDEHSCRHVMWDAVLQNPDAGGVGHALAKLRLTLFRYLIYPTWWRWAYNKRYVGQDKDVLESLYEAEENLQGNDNGILAWRRLAARARKGPDNRAD
ncbi:MAG: Rieske 2Fe-2S domain-containing protein [Rhodospirillaceae bacterium]|nr:Rieske 2Fe-2S domain-containing protein [Rhodospirillaceae bacterium]